MMPTADLTEILSFIFAVAGLILTLVFCVRETIGDWLLLRRERPRDAERLIVTFGWVRAAVGRVLTCGFFTARAWLLLWLPSGSNAATAQGEAIRWGAVWVALYLLVQTVWAMRDRGRLRKLRS